MTTAHAVGSNENDLAFAVPVTQRLSDYQDTTERAITFSRLRLVAIDPVRDLAVLEPLGAEASTAIEIGSSDAVTVGSRVNVLVG